MREETQLWRPGTKDHADTVGCTATVPRVDLTHAWGT